MTQEISAKAIETLKSEMLQNQSNAYVQAIGQYLIQQVEEGRSNAAESIQSSGKKILQSLDYMKAAAEKKAVQGFAMFTPEEGFALVMEFYGIKIEADKKPEPIKAPEKPARFKVSLDEFL